VSHTRLSESHYTSMRGYSFLSLLIPGTAIFSINLLVLIASEICTHLLSSFRYVLWIAAPPPHTIRPKLSVNNPYTQAFTKHGKGANRKWKLVLLRSKQTVLKSDVRLMISLLGCITGGGVCGIRACMCTVTESQFTANNIRKLTRCYKFRNTEQCHQKHSQ